MKTLIVFCVAAQFQFFLVQTKVIPSADVCSRADPEFKSCIWRSVENVLPRLARGLSEYDVAPMDPLHVETLTFGRTLGPNTAVKAVLHNVVVMGLTNFVIEDLKVDTKKLTMELQVFHPHFYIDTDFTVNGNILGTTMITEGHFYGNFTDSKNIFRFSLKPTKQGNVLHYTIDKFKMAGTIADAFVNMVTKNPDEQPLINLLIATFDRNKRSILDLFAPLYGESMGDMIKDVLNGALAKIPAENLLQE